MSHRPLALVSGLVLGDYLLWNWSLAGRHGVLALVSGLTLPPLALACVWLLALNLLRLIASSTQRSRVRADGQRRGAWPQQRTAASGATPGRDDPAAASQATAPATTAVASSSSASAASSSGKLAA